MPTESFELKRINQPGKIALSMFLISIIIGTASAIIMLGLLMSDQDKGFALPTMEKIKVHYAYPLLVAAMKTNMYEYVADDEEIEIVQNWIADGALKDELFKEEVLPIMKDNCTKCHNKTSTMSKAVPGLPLTSYDSITKFVEPGYTWVKMAKQAHLHLFGIGMFLVLIGFMMAHTSYLNWIKNTLIIVSSIALWIDVLGWWLTKFFVNFSYVIFGAGGTMSGAIILMCFMCLADMWVNVPVIGNGVKQKTDGN